jgi:hypothetical protein
MSYKVKRINVKDYNPQIHKLPIAAQDITHGRQVAFNDATADGVPLVWIATAKTAGHAVAVRAKAGEPVTVFQDAFCFGFQVGDIYVMDE